MNKKMRAIQKAMQDKFAESTAALERGDKEKAAALMDEGDALQKDFDLEQRLYEQSKGLVSDSGEEIGSVGKAPSGFAILAKFLRREELTDTEKALITGTNAQNGENFLIPEDVDTTIRELRTSYVSARDLVTVIPTEALTGSFTFESKAPAGLIDFSDGGDIPAGTEPKFVRKPFTIKLKGMLIPVSNVLTGAERASLTAYLNTWFVKNAIISENKDIFAALAEDKAGKPLSGLDALQQSLNLDLDPSCLIGAVIATNQTGFNGMDMEKDSDGNNRLEKDPKNPTQRLFKGLPIQVYPDALLPNVEGKAPVFYGNTRAGCYYIEFMSFMFEASAHAGFKNNTTLLRVIEGYDVIGADVDAYCYGLYTAPAATPASLMGDVPVGDTPVGDTPPYTEAELSRKTNAELWSIAQAVGAAGVTSSSNKAELMTAILAAHLA